MNMTYVVAKTQNKGKEWAKKYLFPEEKFRVLSTANQICGLNIRREDCVYVTTTDADLLKYLMPALGGCRVTSCNEWITEHWKENT